MFASQSPATVASATALRHRAARSQATLQAGDRSICTLAADSWARRHPLPSAFFAHLLSPGPSPSASLRLG